MDSAPIGGPVAARKVVTALFCDVAGSTALGELLDAEVLQSVLSRYFGLAAAVIERHGGTVEKFIGDAVMAVFGVPLLHEDDAVRACRAAHELLAELPRLNDELERDFATRLELRVGVNSGEVAAVAGQLLATGDAVNVAARLEQAAEPGQILIGAATLALAGEAVVVEPLAPLELKGKSRLVQAYRLIAVDPGRPRAALHLDVPMVGRANERERLDEAFRDAVARQACRLVTVLGTAGVGKSRLTNEFLTGIDARVVTGRCLSYGEGITYLPVVEVVKQLADVGELLTIQTPQVAAALGAVMGEGSAVTPGEIAWAARRLFEEAAAERPLVVVFDDIHWGEPTFLDLIEHVVHLSHGASILVLCLARPELLEHRPAWGGDSPGATTLRLQALDLVETGELIDRLIDPGELDPELVSRIRAASAGNPLFVQEMVAMAHDSDGAEVVVPPTIKALLAARIDQLDPLERGVLEHGAVEGELFHRGAVEALAASPEPVLPELMALVRRELVHPDRPTLPAEDAYRFRHLLIRDAAYDALPKAARADLHERFADWLEERGTELIERDEIVAYHLEQAYRYRAELGLLDTSSAAIAVRAAALLIRSGHAVRQRGDYHAASQLLTRAVALEPADRPALLAELGEVFFELGEFLQARAVLDEALTTGDTRAVAMAAIWRAIVAGHSGERGATLEQIIERCHEARAVLKGEGDESRLGTVLAIEGQHQYFIGRMHEATGLLEQAFALARRSNDLHRSRRCLIVMLSAMARGPTPVSEVEALIERIEREAWPEVVPSTVMRLRRYRALMHAFSGRIDEARNDYVEARQLAAELGVPFVEGSMGTSLGHSELINGHPDRAESELRSEYDRLGEYGETGYRSSVAALLAAAILAQGRNEEAADMAEAALVLSEPDDVDPQVRARTVLAHVLVGRGALSDAHRLACEAADLASTTDFVVLRGEALLALAEVSGSIGDRIGMGDALRDALDLFARKENLVQAEQTRALLKDLEA